MKTFEDCQVSFADKNGGTISLINLAKPQTVKSKTIQERSCHASFGKINLLAENMHL